MPGQQSRTRSPKRVRISIYSVVVAETPMTSFRSILPGGILLLFSLAVLDAQQALKRDYPVKPVPFTAVHLNDTFWLPRIETNRKVTIPFAFKKCEETGRVYNFERAAAALRGETVADKTP